MSVFISLHNEDERQTILSILKSHNITNDEITVTESTNLSVLSVSIQEEKREGYSLLIVDEISASKEWIDNDLLDIFPNIELALYLTQTGGNFVSPKVRPINTFTNYKDIRFNNWIKSQIKGSAETPNHAPRENIPNNTNQVVKEQKPKVEEKPKIHIIPNNKNDKSSYTQEYFEKKMFDLKQAHYFPASKYQLKDQKTVAFWSPIRCGVTSLVMNYAMFLSSFRIQIAVLEGITTNQSHKEILERYSKTIPHNWISPGQYLSNINTDAQDTIWNYKGVAWFPFDLQDHEFSWPTLMVDNFSKMLRFYELLFIDLPTGKFESYTLETLRTVDEVWIVSDNSVLTMQTWKKYIHQHLILKNIPCKLVFISPMKEDYSKALSERLEIPLIGTIPNLYREIQQNNYDDEPLITQREVLYKLHDHYIGLTEALVGKEMLERLQGEETFRDKLLNYIFKSRKANRYYEKNMING